MQERISKKPLETEMALPVDRAALDEEMSLVDLWLTIRRRWLWLLGGLIVGLAGAVAYIVVTVPTYESRATLRVGNVPSLGVIEDLGVLSEELIDKYGPRSADGLQERTPHLVKKELKVKNNILELVAVGSSPQETRDFLAQIVTETLHRHQELYVNAVEPFRRRLAAIDGQARLLTAQLKELGDLVARLKDSNPVQASLAAIERGHLYANLDKLERDRVTLHQQTTTPYVNPTQVIAQPELRDVPVSPKRLLAIVAGIVLGSIFGLLAIFLREFFASVRRVSESR